MLHLSKENCWASPWPLEIISEFYTAKKGMVKKIATNAVNLQKDILLRPDINLTTFTGDVSLVY